MLDINDKTTPNVDRKNNNNKVKFSDVIAEVHCIGMPEPANVNVYATLNGGNQSKPSFFGPMCNYNNSPIGCLNSHRHKLTFAERRYMLLMGIS